MKAADYRTDPTLIGFLNWWQQHGEPPEPLVDWLLDQGLDRQAENVRWAVSQGYRRVPDSTGDIGGVRPVGINKGTVYQWARWDGPAPFRNDLSSDRFGSLFGKHLAHHSPTYHEALIALIDAEGNDDHS